MAPTCAQQIGSTDTAISECGLVAYAWCTTCQHGVCDIHWVCWHYAHDTRRLDTPAMSFNGAGRPRPPCRTFQPTPDRYRRPR